MSTDLFAQQAYQPLASKRRPQDLSDFFGQQHLLSEGKPLREAIAQGQPHSMILWGPPGVGKTTLYKLSSYAGKIVVLEWYNPDCPYSGKESGQSVHKRGTVKRTHDAVAKSDTEVVYLLVNSTSNAPKDAVVKRSKESQKQWKLKSPILIDYGGEVGQMYGARTTPHMYVINGDGVLIYQGAYTDSRRGGEEETNYVLGAVMSANKGESCEPASTRPWCCGVKYPR